MKKLPKKKQSKRKRSRIQKKVTPLERATAAYYASMSQGALEEEKRLVAAVCEAASHLNIDE